MTDLWIWSQKHTSLLDTDTTSAIRMFLTQVVAYDGIPFEIKKIQ